MNNLALKNVLFQSNIDFGGFKPTNADLSDYAPTGVFLNVKSPPYSAAADGTTNDRDAITAALADLAAAGGGTLYFPRGKYLANGLLSPYNAVLQLPLRNATSDSAIVVRLLGEVPPPWAVATAFPDERNSTIMTTQSGSGSYPSLLAGSVGRAPGTIPYTDMNNIMLIIENMSFLLPNNPTIHGVRLDGVGWSILRDVRVFAGSAGTEPTTATCGLWLPASQNFSINAADRVTAAGFDTCIRTGEHLRSTMIQAMNCKVGIEFTDGIYPSAANVQLINCVDGLKWTGQHPVDLMVEIEHAPSGWMSPSHDIKDPDVIATGVIRYFIGQGGNDNAAIAASVDGGTRLVLTNLGAGLGT
jgi:hypothetical protein